MHSTPKSPRALHVQMSGSGTVMRDDQASLLHVMRLQKTDLDDPDSLLAKRFNAADLVFTCDTLEELKDIHRALAAHCLPLLQRRINSTLSRIARNDCSVTTSPSKPPPPSFLPSRVTSMRNSQKFLSHLREEQEFFNEHMVSPRFLENVKESSSFDNAKRLARLVLHEKFGVPHRKNIFVGRDIMDWILENIKLNSREEALSMCDDMLYYEFLKEKDRPEKRPFQDDDIFYEKGEGKDKDKESSFPGVKLRSNSIFEK